MPSDGHPGPITGRCYCGASRLSAAAAPPVVTYCHCTDCKRWTGSPLPAFVGFPKGDLKFTPAQGSAVSFASGVKRWFCRYCGSPLAAEFDYLPGQTYVPLGLIDQAGDLPPDTHAHDGSRYHWLHVSDDATRCRGSSRDRMNAILSDDQDG